MVVAERREGGGKSKSLGPLSNPVNVGTARRVCDGKSKSRPPASTLAGVGIDRREFGAESESLADVSNPVHVVVERRETGAASISRPRSDTGFPSNASRVNVEIPKSTNLTAGDPSGFSDTMTLPGFKSR